jgi:hypothetical protein
MIEQSNRRAAEAPIGWAFGPVLGQAKRVWARIADILTVNAKLRGTAVLTKGCPSSPMLSWSAAAFLAPILPRYIFETLDRE